jgi:GT2 family glycosyltransferase
MNLGINHAISRGAEYVIVLNSDTMPEKNFVGSLVDVMEHDRTTGAAGGAIYCYPNTENIWPSAGALSVWRSGGFVDKSLVKKSEMKVQQVTFLSGCAFVLRVAALVEIGLFDERFFMYLEDTELCARLLARGYKLIFVPYAKIYHRIGSEQVQAHQLYFNVRNRFLFNEMAAKGATRYWGLIYLWFVYGMKFVMWIVIAPSRIRWTWAGILDYLTRNFYSGRAFEIH